MNRRALAFMASALLCSGCAELAPLREPPLQASDETIGRVSTRDEAIASFGPPAEVRAGDTGEVLVYRRQTVVDETPNRFYGPRGDQFVQYDRILLYLDQDGKIVRRTVDRE